MWYDQTFRFKSSLHLVRCWGTKKQNKVCLLTVTRCWTLYSIYLQDKTSTTMIPHETLRVRNYGTGPENFVIYIHNLYQSRSLVPHVRGNWCHVACNNLEWVSLFCSFLVNYRCLSFWHKGTHFLCEYSSPSPPLWPIQFSSARRALWCSTKDVQRQGSTSSIQNMG